MNNFKQITAFLTTQSAIVQVHCIQINNETASVAETFTHYFWLITVRQSFWTRVSWSCYVKSCFGHEIWSASLVVRLLLAMQT